MPSIVDNLNYWNEVYDWPRQGDEWSAPWGGSETLWRSELLPRIREFLPARTILEIAPGYGRCTQFLKDNCERLILVDLSPKCIEACRRRFASDSHITYHVNDGKSLEMVPERSVDFTFSFDSLVHAEADVLEDYTKQLAAKLTPHGVGFFHHSNMGAYPISCAIASRVPERFGDARWEARLLKLCGSTSPVDPRTFLAKRGLIISVGSWRCRIMTAELFEKICRRVRLACIYQEKVSWVWGRYLMDCLSIFTCKGSKWEKPNRVSENRKFARPGQRAHPDV